MTQTEKISFFVHAEGGIRDDIKLLRAREAYLRDQILRARPDAPLLNAPIVGRDFTLVVKQGQRRSFDHKALPEAIRSDARFWKITKTTTVITQAQARNVPPEQEDDFQVIEPF